MNRRSFIGRVLGLFAVGPLVARTISLPLPTVNPYLTDDTRWWVTPNVWVKPDLVTGTDLFSSPGQLLARTTFTEPILCKQGDTLETVIEWKFKDAKPASQS